MHNILTTEMTRIVVDKRQIHRQIFVYFDPMAVVTELLGQPALHEYTNKANKLKLNNMLKL